MNRALVLASVSLFAFAVPQLAWATGNSTTPGFLLLFLGIVVAAVGGALFVSGAGAAVAFLKIGGAFAVLGIVWIAVGIAIEVSDMPAPRARLVGSALVS